MHDVIISDAEFKSVATTIEIACTKIDNLVDDYLALLQKASKSGAMEGETAVALLTYANYAKRLKGIAVAFSRHHSSVISSFLETVDTTDSYLYE